MPSVTIVLIRARLGTSPGLFRCLDTALETTHETHEEIFEVLKTLPCVQRPDLDQVVISVLVKSLLSGLVIAFADMGIHTWSPGKIRVDCFALFTFRTRLSVMSFFSAVVEVVCHQ